MAIPKEDPFAALRLSWSELIALEVAFRALSGGLKLHSRTTLCQSYFWSLAFLLVRRIFLPFSLVI